jgi:NarL family two-component system sensor histidine kinase YdfH
VNITEFLLYLIYGYAMITMGIFAIVQKDTKIMNLALVKSLKYLGYFGITHGISEWNYMIIKLEFCHPYLHPTFYNLNTTFPPPK